MFLPLKPVDTDHNCLMLMRSQKMPLVKETREKQGESANKLLITVRAEASP